MWFELRYPQPAIYDAGQYVALSRQIEWLGPLPILEGGGLRTYAYPLLVHAVSERSQVLYGLQATALIALVMILRRLLLPSDVRCDLFLAASLAAMPVLVPYATVLLADLSGAACLQFGLLSLAVSSPAEGRKRIIWLGFSGLCLGAAVQLRPAYFPFAWLAGVWAAWIPLRDVRWRRAVFVPVLSMVVLVVGLLLPATPTLVANAREAGRFSVLPIEGMERLRGYHMTLGLWLDWWSSNPPPFEEREHVAQEWRQRGWAILPIPPYPYPSVRDYWNEVGEDPLHAAGQFARHVYHGFAKSELFPYAGQPAALVRAWIWACNWLLLGVGVREMLRHARVGKDRTARSFARWNLILLAFLVVTCGLVVPEERFTLAIYPATLVFAAGAMARWTTRRRRDALSPQTA